MFYFSTSSTSYNNKNCKLLPFKLLPLTLSLMTLQVHAEETQAKIANNVLDFGEAVVFASQENALLIDIAQPVVFFDQEDIQKNAGQNLGTLLEKTPGLSNSAFGPGVGRPVIRGMHGSRVKIMQNGHDSADLSAMSSDHAPMAEVANATAVEVIQGPSSLRYGGGAIGGVVNVLDNKIHDAPFSGRDGYVETSIGNNGKGHAIAAGMDMGNNTFVLHADAFQNKHDNYKRGERGSQPTITTGKTVKTSKNIKTGKTIQNSDTTGKGGSVGLTWTPEKGSYLGASISALDYEYGVPNEKDAPARVRVEQVRYDVKSQWKKPLAQVAPLISSWQNQLSYTDYAHDEYTAPVIEGLFDKETWELTSTVTHEPLAGWRGSVGVYAGLKDLKLCHDHSGCDGLPYHQAAWNGSAGELLYYKNNLTFAHDTPMPNTKTKDLGLFVVEKQKWDNATLELGARVDKRTITADANAVAVDYRRKQPYYADKSFTPITLSAAGTWKLNKKHRLALSLARAQRAPEAEEIYWNGDHHATFSYQMDNPNLTKETAYTADINWQYREDNRFMRLALYHYLFDGYIYNDRKAVKDPYHANPVYKHEQRDATFTGAEFSVQQTLTDSLDVAFQADVVSAKLKQGNNRNLPRTPPASMLFQLNWNQGDWSATLEDHYRFKQTKVADNESVSNAFNTVNARIGYTPIWFDTDVTLGLQLNNLLDNQGKNHVSYLKDFAPEAGRNVKFTARMEF